MRSYDFFLLFFFGSLIGTPILMGFVRLIDALLKPRRFKNDAEIDAYIKRVMGEE